MSTVRILDAHGRVSATAEVVGRTRMWIYVDVVRRERTRRMAFSTSTGAERGAARGEWAHALRIEPRDLLRARSA